MIDQLSGERPRPNGRYAPGEVIDVFDDKPVVRTVDGSLLIDRYECETKLAPGDILV